MITKKVIKVLLITMLSVLFTTGCLEDSETASQPVTERKVIERNDNPPAEHGVKTDTTVQDKTKAIIEETVQIYDNILNDR